MLEDLVKASNRIVGMKQTIKAIEAQAAAKVFLARDVDEYIQRRIKEKCEKYNVPIEYVDSMEELGEACDIEVGAATAAIMK